MLDTTAVEERIWADKAWKKQKLVVATKNLYGKQMLSLSKWTTHPENTVMLDYDAWKAVIPLIQELMVGMEGKQ